MIGALSGDWRVVLGAAFYGLILAMFAGIVLMIRHGILLRTLKRVYLSLFSWSARVEPPDHRDSPQVPLAVFMAIGAAIAGAEWLLGLPMPWGAVN
jgi:hypothetical protein